MNCFLILLLIANVGKIFADEYVIVNTNNGKIKGTQEFTKSNNKSFYAFKGIRYGENPKRFEIAKPVNDWTNIYDATYDKPICIQLVTYNPDKESEDCLFLNVYTPKLQKSNLAVMFWIHGGSFTDGDAHYTSYKPDYLLDDDVVIVAVNYRLGPFGFLSTGDSKLPGNLGLKDILLALEWVKKNIGAFGGNANSITIFGQSAGGILTSYLVQSPQIIGKNLIHRAIYQSGVSLLSIGFQRNPSKVFRLVAEATNCSSNDAYECLKNIDYRLLKSAALAIDGVNIIYKMSMFNGLTYTPVIEPPSSHAIIVKGSYEYFKTTNKLPSIKVMTGITSEEGLFLTGNFPFFRPYFLQMELDPRILVPEDMYANKSDEISIASEIRHFYFNNGSIAYSSDSDMIRFFSDMFFYRGWRAYLTLVKNRISSYCYVFSYDGKMGGYDGYYPGIGNVSHAEDIGYLFGYGLGDEKYPDQDYLTRNRLVRLWTNFAKTGNPTPKKEKILQNKIWPKAKGTKTNVSCLDIGENLNVVLNPREKQYIMWKELYDMYAHPKDTY